MKQIPLMYHDVYFKSTNESGLASDLYKLSVDVFEKQVAIIKTLEKSISGTVLLTFDDGGSSFYFPISQILDKYDLKGYFFVATKYINKNGFLTEEQIKDIESRGHVIGSHSHTHPDNISTLSQIEIVNEWCESVQILTRILGHPVVMASIPNGYSSNTVLDAAQKAGIRQLYTSKPSCKIQKYKDMQLIGRYVILKGMTEDDVVQLIVSRRKRIFLWLKWAALSVPKFILGKQYEVVKQKILG